MLPKLGKMHLKEITPHAFRQYARQMNEEGYGRSSIEISRTVISGVIRYAMTEHKVDMVDPTPGTLRALKLIRDKKAEAQETVKAMTDEQVGIFLDICEIHRPNYYVMISLMLSTGVRLGEAIALRKSSVNWQTGRVAIKESFRRQLGKTKNKRDRKIDLDPEMLLLLKNQAAKHDGDLMFPHPKTGGYLSQNTVRGNYKWVYLKAGLPLVRKSGKLVPMWPHTARHTFATSAMEDNPNQLEVISQ